MKPMDVGLAIRVLAALTFTGLVAEPDLPVAGSDPVWRRIDLPAGENCFASTFDPANPRRALLGTRPGSLWESLDGGVDQEASAGLIRKLKEISKEQASAELNGDITLNGHVSTDGNDYPERPEGISKSPILSGLLPSFRYTKGQP